MVLWGRGCLCTWAFCNLTPLVFLCHDARIRLEISPASPDKLRLVFFQRQAAGKIMQRHPDMTEALADHLRWIPDGHPLLWRNHPEREFEKVAEGFKTVGQRRRERELTERPTDADREANPGLMSGAEIDEQERVANREAMNAATKLNASHFNEIRIAQIKNGTPAMTPDERAYLIETIPRFEECSVTREQLAAMNDRALMDESYSVWADYASTQI
jgi:hypothetical protein